MYDSLAASGQLSQDQLERFDQRGDELLLPFRFLNQVRAVTPGAVGGAAVVRSDSHLAWESQPGSPP